MLRMINKMAEKYAENDQQYAEKYAENVSTWK
jgi:hypothetical protein